MSNDVYILWAGDLTISFGAGRLSMSPATSVTHVMLQKNRPLCTDVQVFVVVSQ